jgi:ABC-2 type transport system ATP-binding protein
VLTLARDIAAVPASLQRWHVEGGTAHQLKLRYRPSETKVSDILDQVRANQLEVVDLTTVETDLEDIFLQLTRRGPSGE